MVTPRDSEYEPPTGRIQVPRAAAAAPCNTNDLPCLVPNDVALGPAEVPSAKLRRVRHIGLAAAGTTRLAKPACRGHGFCSKPPRIVLRPCDACAVAACVPCDVPAESKSCCTSTTHAEGRHPIAGLYDFAWLIAGQGFAVADRRKHGVAPEGAPEMAAHI